MRSLYNTGPTGPATPRTTSQREYEQNIIDGYQALAGAGITGDVQLLNPAVVEEQAPYERPIDAFGEGVVDFMANELGPGSATAAYYAARTIPFHPIMYPIQRAVDYAELGYINATGKDFLGHEIDPMLANTMYGGFTAMGLGMNVSRAGNLAYKNILRETPYNILGMPRRTRSPLQSMKDASMTVQGLKELGKTRPFTAARAQLRGATSGVYGIEESIHEGFLGERSLNPMRTIYNPITRTDVAASDLYPRSVDRAAYNQAPSYQQPLVGGNLADYYSVMKPIVPTLPQSGNPMSYMDARGVGLAFTGSVGQYHPIQIDFANNVRRIMRQSREMPFGRLPGRQRQIDDIVLQDPEYAYLYAGAPGNLSATRTGAEDWHALNFFQGIQQQQSKKPTVLQQAWLETFQSTDDPVARSILQRIWNEGKNEPQRADDIFGKYFVRSIEIPEAIQNETRAHLAKNPILSQGEAAQLDRRFGTSFSTGEYELPLEYGSTLPSALLNQFNKLSPTTVVGDVDINIYQTDKLFGPLMRGRVGRHVLTRAKETATDQGIMYPSHVREGFILDLRDAMGNNPIGRLPGMNPNVAGRATSDEARAFFASAGLSGFDDMAHTGEQMALMTRGVLVSFDSGQYPGIYLHQSKNAVNPRAGSYGLRDLGLKDKMPLPIETENGGVYIHLMDLIEGRARLRAAVDARLQLPDQLAYERGIVGGDVPVGGVDDVFHTGKYGDELVDFGMNMKTDEMLKALDEMDALLAKHSNGMPWVEDAVSILQREADKLYSNAYWQGSGSSWTGARPENFAWLDQTKMYSMMNASMLNHIPDLGNPYTSAVMRTATTDALGIPTGPRLSAHNALDDFWMRFHVEGSMKGMTPENKQYVRMAVDRHMSQLPRTTKPVTVYRTVKLEIDKPETMVQVGDRITLSSMQGEGTAPAVSTSIEKYKSVPSFGLPKPETGRINVTYQIELPAGSQAWDPSTLMGINFRPEREVILPNFYEYEVVRIEPLIQADADVISQRGVMSTIDDGFGEGSQVSAGQAERMIANRAAGGDQASMLVVLRPTARYEHGGRFKCKKKRNGMSVKKK